MSAIFISHSSKDKAIASELKGRLEQQGYHSLFLDVDAVDGIQAGANWERELYTKLRQCQAMVVVCTESSMASRWCFAEVTQAKALGKQVFPIKISACDIFPELMGIQLIDFSIGHEEAGYDRLWTGLKNAGLDPNNSFSWDPGRPPYPGLLAFQERDAAVFFGREVPIQSAVETLSRLRRFGGKRLAVVLGASGSGKSSLVPPDSSRG